jgi:hypothetical protein
MNRTMTLVLACALVCPTIAFSQTANTKLTPINDVRRTLPKIVSPKDGLILRQDLIDRNNPNNVRSDWPAPSGLPGPGH